jgi:thioredoxin-related protein
MKKKFLKLSIYSLVAFLILLFGIRSISKIKEKKLTEENIQIFPSFYTASIISDHEFCTDSLPNKPVLLMFISPDCDFCQAEIKQLKAEQDKLKDIFILLITSAPKKQAYNFYTNQKLSQLTNLQFLSDEDMKISDYFDVNIIPSIFLYNKDRKLIHKYKGEVKIETLIKYLSE